MSVVSDVAGTTTDPVKKSMELLPIGPVVIIDTPGLDDEGSLGNLRIMAAKKILQQVDIGVLVVDEETGLDEIHKELIESFEKGNINYIIVHNKSDIKNSFEKPETEHDIWVSALTGQGIENLKNKLGLLAGKSQPEKYLVRDLIRPGAQVVLVIPIDKAAPKGRLILPQQQTIRDILEAGGCAMSVRDTELEELLAAPGIKPDLVITDSQAFSRVMKIVPEDIQLTSFSILFARYKGQLEQAVKGSKMLDEIKSGDRILISEGCTHHRQCEDIGTVKLPAWIRKYTSAEPVFEYSSGIEFTQNPEKYKLIIHCGGCMLNQREMQARYNLAKTMKIPMTNYGIAIAYMNGILERSIRIFGDKL
jgi:[FeFe] hydrogenase H-cluster maturation GTPase HydF